MIDLDSKYYNLYNERIFYYLLSGKTYREISRQYFSFNINKVIYKVRKLKKQLNLCSRGQLAYFAVINKLVDIEKVKFYL